MRPSKKTMTAESSSRFLLLWAARTMSRLSMKWIFAPSVLLALAPFVTAQHVGLTHPAGATSFRGGHVGHRAFHRGYFPVGLYNAFYDDYPFDGGYAVSTPPQVIVLQPPQPAPAAEPAPPSQSLMIELQGDRYVQISGAQSSRSEMIDSLPPAKLVTRSRETASS